MTAAGESNKPTLTEKLQIRQAIREKYAQVAVSSAGRFSYPTGRAGLEQLGYDRQIINKAPARLAASFCGVGNPFVPGGIESGMRVLDFGCGAGFDMFVTGTIVGQNGLVCGVDLTAEMAQQAKDNLHLAGLTNHEIRHIDKEDIPYPDSFFDIIISNGAINLSPSKEFCFRELYRVLKPGGKIRFADVILTGALPPHLAGNIEAWAQ